jgi:N-sulfoglucosamine sulfohydrolase
VNRRIFLSGATGALVPPAPAVQSRRPRNILLMIADDLGLHTGEYGDAAARTPNLDRLARDGVRFSNAFCTTASCAACRSVILSGLHNHANGHYGHAHAEHNQQYLPFVRPLPRLLKDAGYRTGLIGKLHVNPASALPFDTSAPGLQRGVLEMAGLARKFIQESAGQPWYLHVGFGDPHRFGRGFANQDYAGVKRLPFDQAKVPVPSFLPDNPAVRAELAEYYEAANRLDQGIGFFLDVLRETGQLDNTLVLFFSDNGIPFPNAKTTVYDAGIHLPFLVRSPDQTRRGVVNHAMLSFVDIFPTVLEWAGAKPPDYPLHGRSFLPILENENPAGWDRIFFSHTFHEMTMYYPMRGVRTPRFKYIRNLLPELEFPFASDLWACATWQSVKDGGGRLGKRSIQAYLRRPGEELYDIQKDPDEVVNLAASPAHQKTLAELRAEVHAWRIRTRDPWLILGTYKGEEPGDSFEERQLRPDPGRKPR